VKIRLKVNVKDIHTFDIITADEVRYNVCHRKCMLSANDTRVIQVSELTRRRIAFLDCQPQSAI